MASELIFAGTITTGVGVIRAGGTEAVMHSIQPHGIDPIIPSCQLLPKGEGSRITRPNGLIGKEP